MPAKPGNRNSGKLLVEYKTTKLNVNLTMSALPPNTKFLPQTKTELKRHEPNDLSPREINLFVFKTCAVEYKKNSSVPISASPVPATKQYARKHKQVVTGKQLRHQNHCNQSST